MRDVEHSLAMASQNIYKTTQMNERRKVWKKITGLKLKITLKIEINQSQNNRDLNNAKMHLWSKFGNPDFNQWWLVARTNSQTQNGVNFYCWVKFDLEDHGQSLTKTIGILTKVFYTNGPNLVILACNGWGVIAQTNLVTDGRTDGRTDGQTQTTTIPGGQNWPRVMTVDFGGKSHQLFHSSRFN